MLRQSDRISHPSNRILRPSDHILLPSDCILRASNRILRPSDRILRPSDRILRPSDRILCPSNRILRLSDCILCFRCEEVDLRLVTQAPFVRLSYTDVVELLSNSAVSLSRSVRWGDDLHREHEHVRNVTVSCNSVT